MPIPRANTQDLRVARKAGQVIEMRLGQNGHVACYKWGDATEER